MKKKSLLFIVLLIFIKINAQNNIYQPTWESLDTRPTPAWFKNAKFGILSIGESILYPCGHLKALTKNGINIGWIIKNVNRER